MVAEQQDPNTSEHRFILQPDCSLSWRETQLFFIAILIVSLGIGVGFALMGAWLILPFAGIEMVLLAVCLVACAYRGQYREIISIQGEGIEIVKGRGRPEQKYRLQRGWARVVLSRHAKRWYPNRLIIRSHGRQIEIGQCLSDEDRVKLAEKLAKLMGYATN